MTAVEYIYANLNTEKIITSLGFAPAHSGDKLRAKCIMHNGISHTSFVMDEETGLWTCHGGCGSGSIFQLVQKINECEFVDSLNYIANVLGLDLENKEFTNASPFIENDTKKLQAFVRRIRKESLEEYSYNVALSDVEKYRSFTPETLRHFGMRLTPAFPFTSRNNKFFWTTPKYIFDLNIYGKARGVALRRVDDNEVVKWSFQPTSFRKKDFLFNYDGALEYCKSNGLRKIYVVEGIFDVMAFWQAGIKNVVSPLGTSISDHQKVLLMQLADELVLAFDGDEPGWKAMLKASLSLKDLFEIKIFLFEEGEDPETKINDLSEESNNAIPPYKWGRYEAEEKHNVTRKSYQGSSKGRRSYRASKWR